MAIAELTRQRLATKLLAKQAEDSLLAFSKEVIGAINPPPGPYALFNHNAHAYERLRDVQRCLDRLYDQRIKLLELDHLHSLVSGNWPTNTPYPVEVQEMMKDNHTVGECMKMDFEALYLFGNILLDQWSLMAAYSCGLQRPEDHSFFRMVAFLEKSYDKSTSEDTPLKELWGKLKGQMLWLNGQVRFYRNKFVVHAARPWQRGHSRSTFGHDFNLTTPSPSGWLDDNKLVIKIKELLPLAPTWLREAPDNYWEKVNAHALLKRLLDHIGEIQDKVDREKVISLAADFGTSTPTFQVVGDRLLTFVCDGTNLLRQIVSRNINLVNIGMSERQKNTEQSR